MRVVRDLAKSVRDDVSAAWIETDGAILWEEFPEEFKHIFKPGKIYDVDLSKHEVKEIAAKVSSYIGGGQDWKSFFSGGLDLGLAQLRYNKMWNDEPVS